jgi:ElaB/YqjD/DUF883 family membrane-anchored ribosome-binding protein
MDDEPEVIRQQMEDTRANLTQKLEALEHQVVGTVQSTTEAVTNTVESVKEAVQGTVEAVKGTVTDTVDTVKETVSTVTEKLDLAACVRQHPWSSFGASVAAGYLGGLLVGGGRPGPARRISELHSHGEPYFAHGVASLDGGRERTDVGRTNGKSSAAAPSEPSWMDKLGAQFAPEIDKLKGLALGALGALVRDMVTRSASGQFGTQLSHLIDDVTRKIGGEPVRGPLLANNPACDLAGRSSREREAANEARTARTSAQL